MSKGYVPKIDVFTAPLPELAEFIIQHLERQGRPSAEFSKNGDMLECLYRGEGIAYHDVPVSCGVGCVVSDEFLDKRRDGLTGSYEAQSVTTLFRLGEISDGRRIFLDTVQILHDEESSWGNGYNGLTDEAKREIRFAAVECST